MPSAEGHPLNEFQRPDSVPPGGVYFYEVASADGPPVRFESHKTVDDLVWQVESYLAVNNFPPVEHLKAKVIEFMCDNLPSGFCRKSPANPGMFITLTQVKDFTSLLFRRAVASSPLSFLSTKEEAERRASVCSECPLNDRSRCTVCGGLLAVVRRLDGRRETSYDPVLGTCRLCGCLLRVKVHVSSEALKAATTKPPEDQIPGFCWLNEVYR
jgi:hypothetical protein